MGQNRSSKPTRIGRWIALAVAAWLAVATLSWLSRAPYTPQAVVAVTAAIVASSFAVWRVSGLYPWPDALRVSFLAAHAVLALGFTLVLIVSGYQVQALTTGQSLASVLAGSRLLRWELLLGLWLYGLIAGGSYTHRLRQRLERERQAREAAAALATRAQLAALRARLHPHFLFNALHSIAALVPAGSAAGQAVEQLGDLLRYALDREPADDVSADHVSADHVSADRVSADHVSADRVSADRVTLAEERQFTRNYLALEKLGMEDKLRIVEEIEPRALACTLPSFTLQTLVENALRHGLSRRPMGGELLIRATRSDGRLRLRVENDLAPETSRNAASDRRGLDTLAKRLRALYGEQAVLDAHPQEDRFVASVTLPSDRQSSARPVSG